MKMRFSVFYILQIFLLTCFTSISWSRPYTSVDDYLYEKESKTISMDFKGASLEDVLKMFSQQSGLNFIAADTISNVKINLYLDKVPVEQALERILSANDLTYELDSDSNIFIVKKLELPDKVLVTRVYHLANATVSASKMNSTLSSGDESGGSSSSSTTGGILATIEDILTEDGTVVEDPRTNSLIVTDIAQNFSRIDATISKLDVKIPMILIEVEMLDISTDNSTLIGAKWNPSPLAFQGGEKSIFAPFNEDNILDDNLAPADHIPGARNDAYGPQYTAGTISFAGLGYTLQFLKTKTDTKSLARPRILTLNNETAEIQITTDEVIGVTQSTTASEGIGTSSVNAERSETGVSLKVTPQANVKTREITMAVEPKVIQARASSGVASSNNFKDTEERTTRSILRIRDGDTIVLGGLLRNTETDINTRVPVVSKIPVLGNMFKHKDNSEVERELIIFISPHILDDNSGPAISSAGRQTPFIREQDIPTKRLQAINNDLNTFDKKRTN